MRITSVWVITVKAGGLRGDREEEGRSVCSYHKPPPVCGRHPDPQWVCGVTLQSWPRDPTMVQQPIPFFGTQTAFMWLASPRVWRHWLILSPLSSPFVIPSNQLGVKNPERGSSHNHSTTELVSSLLQPPFSITVWVSIIKNISVKMPSYHGDKKTILQRRGKKNWPSSLAKTFLSFPKRLDHSSPLSQNKPANSSTLLPRTIHGANLILIALITWRT